MAGTTPVFSVRFSLFVLCRCRWISCLPCTSLMIFQASSDAFYLDQNISRSGLEVVPISTREVPSLIPNFGLIWTLF